MNTDAIKGQWHQVKGAIKQKWSKLTDQDIQQIEGDPELAVDRLQQRYGYSHEQSEREWEDFCSQFTNNRGQGQGQQGMQGQRSQGQQGQSMQGQRSQGQSMQGQSSPGSPGQGSPGHRRTQSDRQNDRTQSDEQ